MTTEPEISAKDDVSSKESDAEGEKKKNGGRGPEGMDDDEDEMGEEIAFEKGTSKKGDPLMNASDIVDSVRHAIEDPLMNASNVVNSMRHAIEDSIRNLEPPMPYYTHPKQRQIWGEAQVVPHKDWGDIFFDLFYVAGAYNLGTMLREEPTLRGLFYFAAAFFPVQSIWQYKMYYDSRFYTGRDMTHQFYELCFLVVLATAVLHIRPVSLLSNPEENSDLFFFCASITVEMFLTMGRSIEIIFMIQDSPAAVITSKREAKMYFFMTIFFLAASIYAGIKYWGGNDSGSDSYYDSAYGDESYGHGEATYDDHANETSDSYYNETIASENHGGEDHHFLFRLLAGAASCDSDSESGYSGNHGDEDHHFLFRLLAGAAPCNSDSESSYSGDVSMGLMLAGFLVNHLVWVMMMLFIIPRGSHGDYRTGTVPMNIDYCIHRYGEWTMLMLGETVLSLLIVGVYQDADFYKIVYSGVISISLLQIIHFRSQPHHADDHAMRRKKERGYLYIILVQLYSAALIILGASYKMLLYEFVYEAEYPVESGYAPAPDYATTYSSYGYDSHSEYDSHSGYGNETKTTDVYYHTDDGHRRLMAMGAKLHRWLAGGGGGGGALRFDKDDRGQRIAHLFCGSMAAVWLLCDLLVLVHKGIKENMHACQNAPVPQLVKLLGIPLLLIRVGLIVFMATLSQYVTDPSHIAFYGLLGLVVQVVLRVVGTSLYEPDHEDEEYEEILKHGMTGEKSMAFEMEPDSDDENNEN